MKKLVLLVLLLAVFTFPLAAYAETEYVIKDIQVVNNDKLSENEILCLIPELKPGKIADIKKVSEQVQLANTSNNVKLNVNLVPVGEEYIAKITVQEGEKDFIFTSVENTGNDYTGKSRLVLGYVDNNLSGKQDLFGVTAVTSPDKMDKMLQLGAFYRVLLPKQGDSMYFTASYADSKLGIVQEYSGFGNLSAKGKGYAIGSHYVHNVRLLPNERANLDFGIDYTSYKNNTDLNILGITLPSHTKVNALKASLTWNHSKSLENQAWAYSVGVSQNLKGDAEDYQMARYGSEDKFTILTGSVNYKAKTKSDWMVCASAFGQYTNDDLVYPEQMSLGGLYTVRGFKQNIIQGDKALCGKLEIYTPEFAKNQRLLAFYDIGTVKNNHAFNAGELSSETISGAGIGWRYTDSKNGLAIGLDYGFALKEPSFDVDDGRGYFSVMKKF